jgi:hypothetical protein
MPVLWSEVPRARVREIAADIVTVVWLGFWGRIGWRIYQDVSGYARAGQTVRSGGTALEAAGQRVGEALGKVPVVGKELGEAVNRAFAGAAGPLVVSGGQMESLIMTVAILLGILIATIPIAIWLSAYFPWRAERLRALRAAHQVIRMSPVAPEPEIQRLLASRAIHRLSYQDLLAYTPDPFGDWSLGRFDRLAQAELELAGLRRSHPRSTMDRRPSKCS